MRGAVIHLRPCAILLQLITVFADSDKTVVEDETVAPALQSFLSREGDGGRPEQRHDEDRDNDKAANNKYANYRECQDGQLVANCVGARSRFAAARLIGTRDVQATPKTSTLSRVSAAHLRRPNARWHPLQTQ